MNSPIYLKKNSVKSANKKTTNVCERCEGIPLTEDMIFVKSFNFFIARSQKCISKMFLPLSMDKHSISALMAGVKLEMYMGVTEGMRTEKEISGGFNY